MFEHLPQELRDRLATVAELSAEDLATLLADIRAHFAEVRAGDDAADHVEELREAVEAAGAIQARQAELAAEAVAREAELAALDAQMSDTPAEEEAPEVETPEPAPAEEPEAPEVEEEETPAAEEEAREPVAAAAPPARPAPVSAAARHVPPGVRSRPRQRAANRVVGTIGAEMGNELPGGLADVGPMLQARLRAVTRAGGGVSEMVPVARIEADYGPERQLGHDPYVNAEQIRAVGAGGPDALVAAGGVCVPAEPYYGMAQISDDARPVRAALASFQAARGGITFIPPNDINDYSAGVDEWTRANDLAVTSSTATWKDALTVACGTPTTVNLRAVTRIMETGNWYDRTHPEAVRADLSNLMAAHARKAEELLLRDIKAGSLLQNAQGWGANTPVGATRDTLVFVGAAAEGMRNRHRIASDAQLDWLAPSWLRRAIQADLAAQMPGDDVLGKALAEIDGYLSARGIRPYWYMDDPGSGFSQYFTAPTNLGTLPLFPVQAQWAMFHDGAWLFLDGGELDLGVSRDFDQNRQNKFGIFAETFEGAAMVGLESIWVTQIVQVAGGSGGTEDLGS